MMQTDAGARMERARQAQRLWAAVPPSKRAKALQTLRWAIARRMDEIIATVSEEMGKPAMDVLTGDVMVTLEQLKFYEKRAARILQPVTVRKPPFLFSGTRFFELKEPFGVVLVCAPWNYPLQLAVIPMATALFAGNAVLLKCSEHTPRTAHLIGDLYTSAGLPLDLVQVSCEPPQVAAALIEAHPDLILFTGSTRGGKAIAAKAAERIIPTILELGGKDPALVFESCHLERAAAGLCYASFSNAGQVCVGTKRIYVQRTIYDRFLELFLDRINQLRIGRTTDSDCGRIHIPGVHQRIRMQVQDAISRGAVLHTPRHPDKEGGAPVVLTEVPGNALLLVDESFGPAVCVALFDSEEDAIRMANSSEFALGATVWTSDQAQARRVVTRMNAGNCCVNDAIRHIGNPYACFGGNKASGFGRYRGAEGLRAFSRRKTVMVSSAHQRSEIHWFPFKLKTFERLRMLMQLRHNSSFQLRGFRLRNLLALLPLLLVWAALSASAEGLLSVSVEMPPHTHGRLAYLLFASPSGFPDQRSEAMRHASVPISPQGGSTQWIDLGRLAPGRYAVSVYVDQNGNHKLDKNWLGIPREPVGASNNPVPRYGPPKFDECSFTHGDSAQVISITLRGCCNP